MSVAVRQTDVDSRPADAARVAGERVEQLLDQLRGSPDLRAAGLAEDLVCCLVQLYGAGLARIVGIAGADVAGALCADPLVESLLLVHDLHPLDTDTRISRALDRIRPSLATVTVDYLGTDDGGVARVRVTGTGHGCSGSLQAVRLAIETAVHEAAPETTAVDVDVRTAPPLLQIRPRGAAP